MIDADEIPVPPPSSSKHINSPKIIVDARHIIL